MSNLVRNIILIYTIYVANCLFTYYLASKKTRSQRLLESLKLKIYNGKLVCGWMSFCYETLIGKIGPFYSDIWSPKIHNCWTQTTNSIVALVTNRNRTAVALNREPTVAKECSWHKSYKTNFRMRDYVLEYVWAISFDRWTVTLLLYWNKTQCKYINRYSTIARLKLFIN